jgi:hypothetical protein
MMLSTQPPQPCLWGLSASSGQVNTNSCPCMSCTLRREYQPFAEQLQQLYPQNADPRLGFLALIAFPNHFSTSFGELGGRQWAHWAARLATLGIPVSCCFLESLSYLRGISAATSSP